MLIYRLSASFPFDGADAKMGHQGSILKWDRWSSYATTEGTCVSKDTFTRLTDKVLARDVVAKLLAIDPATRLNASDVLSHAWLSWMQVSKDGIISLRQ